MERGLKEKKLVHEKWRGTSAFETTYCGEGEGRGDGRRHTFEFNSQGGLSGEK